MGTHRYFDEAGHLVEVKVFRSGVLQASGMLDSLGRRTGPWIEFWPDGEPKAQGPYVAGEREGDWQFFARDGRLEQEGSLPLWTMAWTLEVVPCGRPVHRDERYRKGREDGEFLELGQAGDTLAIGVYERGLRGGSGSSMFEMTVAKADTLDGERDGPMGPFGWRRSDQIRRELTSQEFPPESMSPIGRQAVGLPSDPTKAGCAMGCGDISTRMVWCA